MSVVDLSLLIPILGIVLGLGLPLVAVIVWIVMNHRRKVQEIEARHKERLAAIDKGIIDLPPDPAPPPAPTTTGPNSRYLLRGMIWFGVGLAFTLGMDGGFWNGSSHASPGWIAVAIGVAYLVFYFVEGRRPAAPPAPPPAVDQHGSGTNNP